MLPGNEDFAYAADWRRLSEGGAMLSGAGEGCFESMKCLLVERTIVPLRVLLERTVKRRGCVPQRNGRSDHVTSITDAFRMSICRAFTTLPGGLLGMALR